MSIDVANWVMNGPPVAANGIGGAGPRVAQAGDIWDHHFVEFDV